MDNAIKAKILDLAKVALIYKNRGAQALRALDLSREVRRGPPANHTQAGARRGIYFS